MTTLQQILGSEGVYGVGRTLLPLFWALAFAGSLAAVTSPDSQTSFRAKPPFEAISRDWRPNLKEHVASGTTLRAGFVPSKAHLVQGEPLEATFTVENLGPGDFKFLFGCDTRGRGRHDRFKIAVTDADAKLLPDPRALLGQFGGLGSFETLKPGQTFTSSIDLTHFRKIDSAGVYTVKCRFAFDEDDNVKKGQAKPVVESRFRLTILERTPQRVAEVLDELVAKAQSAEERDLGAALGLIARFGQEEAVPRLVQLAGRGPVARRAAALTRLGLVPSDTSINAAVTGLKDANPIIRAAAAGALGAMQQPRAVKALLAALPGEKPPVANAVLVALGTSRSDRALPLLVRTLDRGIPELKPAAVTALVAHGSPGAVAALQKHVETSNLSLRYRVILALAEKLGRPINTDWLLPLLMRRALDSEWLDTLRLLRMYGSERAIPALLSGLDFEAPWSWRNWWILHQVGACPKAPAIAYTHDPNREGTPAELKQNRRTLAALKKLAGPIPTAALAPKAQRAPYLKTDPPIDFKPILKPVRGAVEIKSGFLQVTLNRTSCSSPYSPSAPYRPIYELAQHVRGLVRYPDLYPALGITAQQAEQLSRLPPAEEWPNSTGWTQLYIAYKEAPPGPLQERAREDLCEGIRVASQEHHAAVAALAGAARKVLTADQLTRLPDLVEKRRRAPSKPATKPAGSGTPRTPAGPEGR
jgi:HEAT repeat protein